MQDQLRGALERGEFSLYYQPICNAARQIVTLEALLRWNSPELGLLAPGQFLPAAQQIGLDAALGDWVLGEACAQLARWQAAGHGGLRMAVNISRTQLGRQDLPERIDAALAQHGLNGTDLELEVSEPLLTSFGAQSVSMMQALQQRGLRWSLCGFGAQHSAVRPLLRLPVQVIKIDRGVVCALSESTEEQEQARRAVQAIVALAGALGLSVVAEGVETRTQWQTVTDLGCEHTQGFWLGHPQNAPKTAALLLHTAEHAAGETWNHRL